jgi:cytochrome c556
MTKIFRTFFLSLIAGLFLTVGSFEIAQADGTAEIKARKAAMKAIGGHMGGIKLALKGAGGTGALVAHAEGMASMGKIIASVFPKGSESGKIKTRTLPEAWSKPAEFKAAADAFTTASAAFLTAAKAGDKAAIGAGIKNLGKSCGGCHKPFRAKKSRKKM